MKWIFSQLEGCSPPTLMIVTNVQAKAIIFNKIFVLRCSTIITRSTILTFRLRCDKTLCDVVIGRLKVLRLITSLVTNKTYGWDEILAHMIKICDSSFVEPLCQFCKTCLATGNYPSMWKKANIVPIHKRKKFFNVHSKASLALKLALYFGFLERICWVWNDSLISKLETCGISSNPLTLMCNFLHKRK